jgi:hypothetical protein
MRAMKGNDKELDETEKEVRRWRWREASGAVLLVIAFMVLIILIAAY